MAFVRKIKGSLVTQDSSVYIGEETYLFYDIQTGCIRRCDGTPGGAPIAAGCFGAGTGGSDSWRPPAEVRDSTSYASSTNFPTTGTIDGVAIADGARVLFDNVTAAGESNVWIWDATLTTWTEDTKPEENGDAIIIQDGTSANEFWMYDGTNWVQFSGGTGTALKHFYGHNGNVIQTYSVATTVNFGTNVRSDTNFTVGVDIGGSTVTINTSGWYKVIYEVTADNTSGQRREATHELQLNGVAVPGTVSGSYHRNSTQGITTATATAILNLSATDVLRVRSQATGPVITIANGCRLNIQSVDGP